MSVQTETQLQQTKPIENVWLALTTQLTDQHRLSLNSSRHSIRCDSDRFSSRLNERDTGHDRISLLFFHQVFVQQIR